MKRAFLLLSLSPLAFIACHGKDTDSKTTAPTPTSSAAAKAPVSSAAPVTSAAMTPTSSAAVAPVASSAAASSSAPGTMKMDDKLHHPTTAGGPGPAVDLKGDATAGQALYDQKCKKCHGPDGKGGVENKGADEKIPALHPLDGDMLSKDRKAMLVNLDLFMEHGSTPKGPSPDRDMPAFGDMHRLQPQEIANVLALVMSWNP